ncbi:MAG TPA: hypothetical protein DEB39_07195 [Planctomycetaceae bacterium]|nr:hypothetical protein [Planctomycetaceae bacterium]
MAQLRSLKKSEKPPKRTATGRESTAKIVSLLPDILPQECSGIAHATISMTDQSLFAILLET